MTNMPFAVKGQAYENLAPDTTNTRMSTAGITAGTANTKGSYSQLIAATSQPADGFYLFLQHEAGASSSAQFLLDIAIGGAGSEVIIVSDFFFDSRRFSAGCGGWWYHIPVYIPSGVRVAARMQTNDTGETLYAGIVLIAGGPFYAKGFAGSVGEGVQSSGASRGTDVDPGGTAHTKGSWTQIVASTAENYAGLLPTVGWSDNGAATTSTRWLIDIAIGASASEVIIAGDWLLQVDAIRDGITHGSLPVILHPIPAGTRIAVRAQSNETNATDRLFDISFNGLLH